MEVYDWRRGTTKPFGDLKVGDVFLIHIKDRTHCYMKMEDVTDYSVSGDELNAVSLAQGFVAYFEDDYGVEPVSARVVIEDESEG